ncbi:AraC-type DNA-binding protein [Pseudomonas cedrina]|uniref:AraC-type DNA-binding protein n=1 Tax=Pseudomonas cedrina TaxID=651740 RepID=A0ABY0UR08_PSECE|nr:AraC-type DNA-binding protein [Pseudomonas cedrina]
MAERSGRSAALESLTRLIMISLLRLCSHSLKATPARHEDLKIFHRFNELIEAHYQQHWPLSRYAEGIGVTEARLNDVCRRIADLPSKRLIMERLMQEAKRLLLFTGSSANEICYQLGFKVRPISVVSSSATHSSLRGSTASVNRVCVERGIGILALVLLILYGSSWPPQRFDRMAFTGNGLYFSQKHRCWAMFN